MPRTILKQVDNGGPERDHLLRSRTKHPSVMWAIGRLKIFVIIRSALYLHFRNTWVDCNKGARERHSTPEPLSNNTGEYSPCQTQMATSQSDDGTWSYVYSELPGLVPISME